MLYTNLLSQSLTPEWYLSVCLYVFSLGDTVLCVGFADRSRQLHDEPIGGPCQQESDRGRLRRRHCPDLWQASFTVRLVRCLTLLLGCLYICFAFSASVIDAERWGTGMVICLERGADLHMAQLMPLPLTVSCFSKIHPGFTFSVLAHPGSPGKRAVKQCVCVCAWLPVPASSSGMSTRYQWLASVKCIE